MEGLMYVLGGAAEGLGEKLVREANLRREMRLEELRHGNLLQRENLDREFRRETQKLDLQENQRQREHERGLLDIKRKDESKTEGEYITGPGGDMMRVRGDRATTVRDAQGKPIPGTRADTEQPADVKTAEWLVSRGVAADYDDAWNRVRRATDDPDQRRRLVYDMAETLRQEEAFVEAPLEERMREAERILGGETPSAASAVTATPPAAEREEAATTLPGASPTTERSIGSGTISSPIRLRPGMKPEDMVQGKIYQLGDGSLVTWTGDGFDPVDTAAGGENARRGEIEDNRRGRPRPEGFEEAPPADEGGLLGGLWERETQKSGEFWGEVGEVLTEALRPPSEFADLSGQMEEIERAFAQLEKLEAEGKATPDELRRARRRLQEQEAEISRRMMQNDPERMQ